MLVELMHMFAHLCVGFVSFLFCILYESFVFYMSCVCAMLSILRFRIIIHQIC